MTFRHVAAIEYATSDTDARRLRLRRRLMTSAAMSCAAGFVVSALAWSVSAADPNPDSIYVELGEERFGVGIVDQYSYWYWKTSDVFRFSVQIPLWSLMTGFAVGCGAAWLLRWRVFGSANRRAPALSQLPEHGKKVNEKENGAITDSLERPPPAPFDSAAMPCTARSEIGKRGHSFRIGKRGHR
jgi:hypothetical protein